MDKTHKLVHPTQHALAQQGVSLRYHCWQALQTFITCWKRNNHRSGRCTRMRWEKHFVQRNQIFGVRDATLTLHLYLIKILNRWCTITVVSNRLKEYMKNNTIKRQLCTSYNITWKSVSPVQFVFPKFLFTHTILLQKKVAQSPPAAGHCTACSATPSYPAQLLARPHDSSAGRRPHPLDLVRKSSPLQPWWQRATSRGAAWRGYLTLCRLGAGL